MIISYKKVKNKMKKLIALFLIIFCSTIVYAKTITLQTDYNTKGEIVIENTTGIIEDKLRVGNDTNTGIEVIIKGNHRNLGLITVASGFIKPKDTRYLSSKHEGDLDSFKSFIISLKEGKIIKYTAEMNHDDLIFSIHETDLKQPDNSSTVSPADELIKWKQLLDMGGITKEEYEAKKKQLLGL
jgi:hypothetical protein